jgi:biotin transport system substrate-specific component
MADTAAAHAPLIDRVWAQGGNRSMVRNIALAFSGVALLTISEMISVPFYPVPMTLQTLAVLLIGAAYGWRLGAATVLLYLAHGFFGAPVFANTPPSVAGPMYFMGPTAGFLIGFVASAAIAGYAAERGFAGSTVRLFGALLLAQTVVFGLGFLWLAQFAQLASGATGVGFDRAFGVVQTFALGDLLKTALATAGVALFARRLG